MDQIMAEAGLDMAACLERVRRSDEEAARAMVRELYPLVMKIVRSHLPRRTDEEDLSQMVFAKIFAHVDHARFGRAFRGRDPGADWLECVVDQSQGLPGAHEIAEAVCQNAERGTS